MLLSCNEICETQWPLAGYPGDEPGVDLKLCDKPTGNGQSDWTQLAKAQVYSEETHNLRVNLNDVLFVKVRALKRLKISLGELK